MSNVTAGAEVERHINAFDWSTTPLGARASWPRSLQTTVRIMLDSRYAMWLGWGPDLTFLYNDAYASMTLGPKHPWALGRPASEVWAEIWDEVGPRAQSVINTGQATWDEGLLLYLERSGYPEETYHTFSYSPVPNDDGGVGGMLCVVTEDTERTIGERRLQTLRDLASRTMDQARTAEQACKVASDILATNRRDVPFALLYLIDGDTQAALAGHTGIIAPIPASVATIDLSADAPWPFRDVMRSGSAVTIDDVGQGTGMHVASEWPEAGTRAMLLPMTRAGHEGVSGFAVIGISPRRPLDEQYRGFLDLLAKQVSTAVSNAAAFADQRRRADTLAELDRAKTNFFSNVSHEFRTPLTLMLGPLEEVLDSSRDELPEAVTAQLDTVNRNGMRLMRLVNTLLEFTRIEAGRTRAEFAPTDLATVTTELASVFRAAVERAGVKFDVHCDALHQPVYVDRAMWEKVVLNLLSNALKFTFDGAITVTLRAIDGQAELVVRDTGTGIPAAELPMLFQRFHRVRNAHGRTHEGSGIGLALVQELVALHGGTVQAASREGEGSAFTIRLPFGSIHLPADQVVTQEQARGRRTAEASAFVEEALQWLDANDAAEPAEARGMMPREPADDARAHVLLADDNADMRAYVSRLLSDDYRVTVVSDGQAALDAIDRHMPDLILTDIMMPVMDGFALLEAVRGDERTADVPVIMLSARAGEENRIEGATMGADDYLVKPFSARELLARVGGHLQLSKVRRSASEAAKANEAQLQMVLRAARVVAWKYDTQLDRVSASENLAEVYGLARNEDLQTMNRGLALLPAEDRERHAAAVRSAIEANRQYTSQFRVRRPKDGAIVWVEEHGFPYPGPDGSVNLVGVVMDITARKLAELELLDADRKKDEFLATLAHELRNPLAPMRNALELLKLSGANEDMSLRARAILERQLQHMVRLIDDLLDVSRISLGKVELRIERLALDRVISDAIDTSRPLIDAREHALIVEPLPPDLELNGDGARLSQVFSNLLNNAAKFTAPGGRIVLSTTVRDGAVDVAIRDSGEGIPAAMLEHVFDMFTQVDPGLEKVQGGLGIGLSLVRALLALHGGTVSATSEGEGMGSTFTVRLPLADISAVQSRGREDSAETADVVARRILVVDDNRDSAESLGMMLRVLGHETRTAGDGTAAIALAENFAPDVVLLDIGMPLMNGYDVCRRMRNTAWGRHAVIIAVTGWGQASDKALSAKAGFDHHLVKPVDPDQLNALMMPRPERDAHRQAHDHQPAPALPEG